MWIVTVGTKMYDTEFYVEDEETKERCGVFDCKSNAQEMADELNEIRYHANKSIDVNIEI